MAGFLGIGLGIFVYIGIICNLKSFGVPFMVPYAPVVSKKGGKFFLSHLWENEQRPGYLNTKRVITQDHFSRNWKRR